VNILRRLPLSRLLLLCGLVVAIGIGATALATAVGAGPTPPPKPLPEAVHDALAASPPAGVSARIQFSNHLVEGASLASGGSGATSGLAASPLLTGASGRLWIAADGRTRLELQSEKGDSQILYDGHTVSLYDASTNTLYRYTPQQESGASGTAAGSTGTATGAWSTDTTHHAIPTAQEIQEAIAKAAPNATFSGATPTDVAGQPAYTVRISPSHNGGLIGGAELSWDANNGVPLRAAVYSSTSSAAVIELAATEISYGPVDSSTVDFTPPANAKVEEVTPPEKHESQPSGQPAPGGTGTSGGSGSNANAPTVTAHGEGLAAIRVIEAQAKAGAKSSSSLPEGLPQVKINGATATELATPLGTLLSFERNSVRYLLVGSVTPAAIEAFARGM
jgi:outer membrane lipoprotein-sorting protein